MQTNLHKISGFLKVAIILLVLLGQFAWAAAPVAAASGTISGVIVDHTHGYPITGVSVRVEAIRKADGTGAASTYTDPTDGTFSLIGLTLDEELALLASNEYPDVDGYDPVYYDNATDIDWARTLVPTSATPDITDLRITLDRPSVAEEHLTFNVCAGCILEDVNLRQAIAYAIDRQAILDGAFAPAGVIGEILNSLIYPGVWYEAWELDPQLTVYTYSPSTAETLLTNAGWEDLDGDGLYPGTGLTAGILVGDGVARGLAGRGHAPGGSRRAAVPGGGLDRRPVAAAGPGRERHEMRIDLFQVRITQPKVAHISGGKRLNDEVSGLDQLLEDLLTLSGLNVKGYASFVSVVGTPVEALFRMRIIVIKGAYPSGGVATWPLNLNDIRSHVSKNLPT